VEGDYGCFCQCRDVGSDDLEVCCEPRNSLIADQAGNVSGRWTVHFIVFYS
jgi:hypothetical protein